MIDTAASAAAEIRRLGLPAVLGAIMDGTLADDPTAPAYLRWEYRQPQTYFQLCHELVRRVPELAGLCPLWEQNGEAIIGRLPNSTYARFYYEDAGLENPGAAIELLGKNYQQFVTSVLVALGDAGLWDKYAEAVAGALQYKHLAGLDAVLRAWTKEHGESELARFRESLA
jgi:hypothetical protein